jgi:hypothetical protein
MKKVLAVVLAAAFVTVGAMGVSAQTPNIQVYFDSNLSQTAAECQGIGAPQTLYVVANNFNMFLSAVEYSIDYSGLSSLFYLADIPVAPLNIGSTATGVASSWNIPQNAFGPMIVMTVLAQWNCDDCAGELANQSIVVEPNPSALSGQVQAVRWPDNVVVVGLGMTSLVCPGPVPVAETTWGQIKSLYNN